MKNIFSLHKLVLGFAVLSWIIPFVLSAFFINMETGEPIVNPILFHGGLFLLFAGLVYFFYSKLKKKNIFSLSSVYTFVGVNIILDIIVLLGLLQAVSVSEWLMIIAPVYFIVCYGIYFLMKK